MKYEFTSETIEHCGATLRRIRRIRDSVVGGYLETEGNLSQDGNACMSYYATIKADRKAWRDSMPQRCMACGRAPDDRYVTHEVPVWLEVHEIERRGHAPKSYGHPCNYLLLCHWCHGKMGAPDWPHARQLALKRLRDHEHFDLEAWLSLKPRPATYVTINDIAEEWEWVN